MIVVLLLVGVALVLLLATKFWNRKESSIGNLPKGGTPVKEPVEDKPSRTPKKRDTPVEK